jgi:hypothetical protein
VSLDIEKKFRVCHHLLALAADRNLINPLDLKSSLGYFRIEMRAIQDHEFVHNYTSSLTLNRGRIESIERLVSPMTGPTPADNLVLDATRNRRFQHGANGVDMERTMMTNMKCKDIQGKIGCHGALDIFSRFAGLHQAGQRELQD